MRINVSRLLSHLDARHGDGTAELVHDVSSDLTLRSVRHDNLP
jgi:hypothetical protein